MMDKITRRRFLEESLALLAVSAGAASAVENPEGAGVFIAAPYIQLGDAPKLSAQERLEVMWLAPDADAAWEVRYRSGHGNAWRKAEPASFHRVAVANIVPHRVYSADLVGLKPGALIPYTVYKNAEKVFEAQVRARKHASSPYRFVIYGDCGAGTIGQRRIAYHTYMAKPDFVVIPGDIIYGAGLISQYRERYFPVYNADHAAADVGSPLSRSTLFIGVLGNHDVGGWMLGKTADGLAYYLYFSQPLNGPDLPVGALNTTPLDGPDDAKRAFLTGAGAEYPRIGNFSFDYGNSHWTAIDANPYVHWNDPGLRRWLEDDLNQASQATWKFVTFHQPGFSSSHAHYGEQHMRLLAPLFEKHGVDVVWAGHVHNYQRSKPMKFAPAPNSNTSGPVSGQFTLDEAYDGAKITKANGVMYIVTGGGGATLYDPDQEGDPSSWQSFTTKFFSTQHSLTIADVHDGKLSVRQVAEDGHEVDRFAVTKA